MLLHVDRHSGVPAYRQILEQVRFQLAGGMLAPGDELPSTRALSAELGLNPMTVSKAYGQLEREGLVERRPGRPLVVRPRDGQADADRRGELRRGLESAARMARQLGIGAEEATELFAELLDERSREEER